MNYQSEEQRNYTTRDGREIVMTCSEYQRRIIDKHPRRIIRLLDDKITIGTHAVFVTPYRTWMYRTGDAWGYYSDGAEVGDLVDLWVGRDLFGVAKIDFVYSSVLSKVSKEHLSMIYDKEYRDAIGVFNQYFYSPIFFQRSLESVTQDTIYVVGYTRIS